MFNYEDQIHQMITIDKIIHRYHIEETKLYKQLIGIDKSFLTKREQRELLIGLKAVISAKIEDLSNEMNKSCECETPQLQPQTKKCGKCGLYIDRVKHIININKEL